MFVLEQLPGPAVRVASLPVDNNGCLLVVIHQTATPLASIYHLARDGSTQKIISSNPLGKDDSATAVLFPDGMLWLIVSESDPVVGSSGATSKIRVYDVQTELRPATGASSNTDPLAHQRIDTVARRQRDLRRYLAQAADTL